MTLRTSLTAAAFVALSVSVTTLALVGFRDQALALAIPGYSALTAMLHHKVARVEASIGPVNGSNVHDLLERLIGLDEYQHTRNHDILGALSPTNAHLSTQLLETRQAVAELVASQSATERVARQTLAELIGHRPPDPPHQGEHP